MEISLSYALNTSNRLIIEYDNGIVKGYVSKYKGLYYITYNKRSIVRTKIDLERITKVRYSLSRVILWRALGRR